MNEIRKIIQAKGRATHSTNVFYNTSKRLCKLNDYFNEHIKATGKEPSKQELICFGMETERMVIKYRNIRRECNETIKQFYTE